MKTKFLMPDFGGFPWSGDADSVSKCVKAARQKAKEGKDLALWEKYLCARFDEWLSWAEKRHTVLKTEGGYVSFVAGKALLEPEPTFSFEQIVQASLPLRAHFKNGYDTAMAAEELLRACHYRARANQRKARAKNDKPERYQPTVSFEEGIQYITGNQRDSRAKERFLELVELVQAEAVFSGMFPEPWCFCDPEHSDRVEALLEGLRPHVTPPAVETERYQDEGFTLEEVERMTLARNRNIETGWIKGKPVRKPFVKKSASNEKKACVAKGDKKHSKTDTRTKVADAPGKKSDMASVSERRRKSKR